MQYPVRRMGVVGVSLALVLLAACGGDKDELGPTATVPQPTTTLDPYAVPEVIDEPYVNRVLAGLDHGVGEVARLLVRDRVISQEMVDRLKALYSGAFLNLTVASLQADLRNGLANYSAEPGDQKTITTRFISSSPTCIFIEASRDYSAVTNRSRAPSTVWIAIRPSEEVLSVPQLNPTGWVFIYDGFSPGEKEPEDPCVAVS